MAHATTQINLKLSEDTLATWDEYIDEETPFTSRSEFIRFAVTREINDQHGVDIEQLSKSAELMTEVIESVEELATRMTDVERDMETLQAAVREDPEVTELANNIFSVLPDEEPGTYTWREELQNRQTQAQAQEEKTPLYEWQATTNSLADAFDRPPRKVQEALNFLIADTHLVQDVETDDGQTRYWKEV